MTIKDIARLSGVSITTVSRVLNNRPDVSAESRRKVEAVIESTNYIPNNSARDLVKTKSEAIGLVVRGVSNPFYTYIIRAIEEEITAMGGTMVMVMIALLAVLKNQGYLVDICLIYAMISFLAVVVLTRIYTGVYRQRKAREEKKKEESGNADS